MSCKKIVKGGKADDINRQAARFFHGDSPFHQACRFGHLSVVLYVLALSFFFVEEGVIELMPRSVGRLP